MDNVVIVAIPDENDRVWKISSEKVPHLTMLFLGEEGNVANLDQIMLFVEHAANTSLKRFYLPVDRRGELGADQADVLFFKKGRYDFKAVRDFRSLLLKDPNVKTAYDSTKQFETPEAVGDPGQPWIPHLTLGYPATPAKPIPDDQFGGIYSVEFNRIAVWTGDFEGPEFLLKDYGEEFDEVAIPMDVAMSELQHYGVKGQKWGVRRRDNLFDRSQRKWDKALDQEERSVAPGTRAIKRNVLQRRARANRGESIRLQDQITNEIREKVKVSSKKELGNLRKDPRFQNINYRDEKGHPQFDTKKFRALEKEEARIWSAHLNKHVEGQQKFEIKPSRSGNTWEMRAKQVKHAEDDEPVLLLRPIRDEEGFLIDVEPIDIPEEKAMTQTIELGAEFISHYGTKGMKWGVRKQEVGKGGHIRISNRTNVAGVSTASGAAIIGVALVVPGVGGLGSFLHPRVRREWKAASDHNKLVRQDKKWKKRIDKSKKGVEVHNTAADEINKKIGDFNNDKRWKDATGKDIDLAKNPAKQKEYDDAATKELLNPAYANAAVKVYGSKSPSERYTFEIKDAAKGELKMTDALAERRKAQLAGAKHAATDDDDLIEDIIVPFKISRDANGHILGFKLEDQEEDMAQTADLGVEFLAHYGVKGMKWGVRRAAAKVGRGIKKVGRGLSALGASLADSSWQSSTYSDIKHEAVHNHVAKDLDHRVTLLQKSPKYRNKDLKADSDLRKEYYQDVAKVSSSSYRRGVREIYGENYTGTKSAHYVTDARGPRIEVRSKATGKPESEAPLTSKSEIARRRKAEAATASHAALSEAPDLTIELKLDSNGQISGVGFVKPSDEVEDSMAQSVSDVGAAFVLEHYGVKGMRWGHHKAAPEAVGTSARSIVPHGTKRKTKIKVEGGENQPAHEDAVKVAQARTKLVKSGTASLSNKELKDMANRLQLEQQVKQLTTSGGKKFVGGFFKTQGQQSAERVVRRKAMARGF